MAGSTPVRPILRPRPARPHGRRPARSDAPARLVGMSDTPWSPPPGTTDGGGRERMLACLERAVEGTPYRLDPDDRGVVLSLDIADASWWGTLSAAGVTAQQREIVRFPSETTVAITDEIRELRWSAGRPSLVTGSLVRGRIRTRRREVVWGWRADGSFGRVLDLRLDSAEARELVEAAAAAAGLTVVRGGAERGAIIAAWVGGAVALLGIVVALVVTLAVA